MRKDERITGLEYYLRKRRVYVKELKELTGVGFSNLKRWRSVEYFESITKLGALLQIADYLGITMDQMAETHYAWELEEGDRPLPPSKHDGNGNCISRYRSENGLSYRQLAERMGCTTQNAMSVCSVKRSHRATIQRIADHERITADEFIERYDAA